MKVVVYETESIHNSSPESRYNPLRPIDAVWTYSHFNVDRMLTRDGWFNERTVKFVPCGYSPVYDYKEGERTAISTKPITFVSDYGQDIPRLYPLRDNHVPYENVHAWSHYGFAKNVSSPNFILINLHKPNWKCLETFRLGPALSNGMTILSEHASPSDEAAFEGLITFMNTFSMNFY